MGNKRPTLGQLIGQPKAVRDKMIRDANSHCPAPIGSAFYKGWKAAESGTVVGDNPFDESLNDHWQWMNGWVNRKELNVD